MLGFDCYYFCRQIVEAAKTRGWNWVKQADSNCIVHYRAHKTNVTELAKGLGDEHIRKSRLGARLPVMYPQGVDT